MSLRINTNVAALNSYNNLSANQTKLEGAFQQLSSGLRINKAADDAAGLSIAQGLTSQINGLTQAVSNAQDGINVAQIADGALGTVQDILQRMRGLVVKAGNEGTQDSKSLAAIQKEIVNLNTQLDNINGQTKFGQTNLLDGSYDKNFQVGANGGDTISLTLSTSAAHSTNVGGKGAYVAGVYTKSTVPAEQGVDLTALSIATAGGSGSAATAYGNTIAAGNVATGGAPGSLSADLDNIFTGALGGTDYIIAGSAGSFTISDSGGQIGTITERTGADAGVFDVSFGANGTGVLGTPSVPAGAITYSSTDASNDLDTINSAIDKISAARSQIGAVQNQLNYTVTNLQTAITNVTASRSNLTDADLAQQVTSMTQSQILTQAATSVLAQANSAPQAILKLLQ